MKRISTALGALPAAALAALLAGGVGLLLLLPLLLGEVLAQGADRLVFLVFPGLHVLVLLFPALVVLALLFARLVAHIALLDPAA